MNGEIFTQPTDSATNWLRGQSQETWDSVRPTGSRLSGDQYETNLGKIEWDLKFLKLTHFNLRSPQP